MMLPFDLGGFHWGDDIVFDQAAGDLDFDAGFEKAVRVVGEDVVRRGLFEKCGYEGRDVFVFGFGQGGMVGLAVLAGVELGGAVSIGGPLPSSVLVPSLASGKAETPVLVLGGSSNTLISVSAVSRIKSVFKSVDYKVWSRAGDDMPRNREEMMPIMQFFGKRLKSRRGIPDGSIDVTG
jgi:predicted esterase